MKHSGWLLIFGSLLMGICMISRPACAGNSAAADASQNAATALEKAHEFVEKGEYGQALRILEPFAEPSLQTAVIYSDYVVIQFWAGNVRKAIALFEAMPDSIPRRPYLLRNMAKAYADIGRHEDAARYYAQVVKKDPGDMIAKRGLILTLLRQKRHDGAETWMKRWQKTDRNDPEFKLLEIEWLFHSGHPADALLQLHELEKKKAVDPERIEQIRKSLLAAEAPEDIEPPGPDAATERDTEDVVRIRYLAAPAFWRGFDRELIYRNIAPAESRNPSDPELCKMGWAAFQAGQLAEAEVYFKKMIGTHPAAPQGEIGLAHVYAAQGKTSHARKVLNHLSDRYAEDNPGMRFAFAYVYEKAGRYCEAIAVYDAVLADFPQNATAAKLRLYALADLGLTSAALRQAMASFAEDEVLHENIKARKAINYINWDEPEKAVQYLEAEIGKTPDSSLRIEYVAALVAAKRTDEAVAVYETLESEGVRIPAWIMVEAGDACLAEHLPEQALLLYEQAISKSPVFWKARMGKINALKDLRRWRAAENELQRLESAIEATGSDRDDQIDNPLLLDLSIAKGWLLADEERLMEADAHFTRLRGMAPANLDVRSGEAHVASWRGWKRKALEQFNIIESIDPEYMGVKPGKIAAMDTLAWKETARGELAELHNRSPRDEHLLRTGRRFQVDSMHAFEFELAAQREDDGTNDVFMQATVSTPLSLYTRLHAFSLWRRTWNDDLSAAQKAAGEDEPAYFRRAGIGFDHIFNSTWELRQQFSMDYAEGGDFGSYTRLRITPDDHWIVDGIVDTFTIDVPGRARIRDVEAVKTAVNTVYRVSERREYSLLLGRQWFSDDNNRDEALAGVSQRLWARNDWKMRLSAHAYYSTNSEYDDPTINYFNPRRAWGLSATHMTEQIVYQRYIRNFIHRLYLSVGNYKQYDFDNGLVASARYEQDHTFTDTHFLRWALSFGRNVYDGDSVLLGAVELMYIWRF